MHLFAFTLPSLCLILSLPAAADATSYQTEAKPPSTTAQQSWNVPVISVNPATGQQRVFITPLGELGNGLASHEAPVYHARALYQPTATAISTSITSLHQQMAEHCPQGWIKRQEWAILQSDTPELHYQFQCLDTLTR